MRLFAGAVIAILPLAPAGCGEGPGPAERTILTTDSAGIRIVTHPTGSRDTLRVAEDDIVLAIGTEGDPVYEFFRVRYVEALSDGRIVVADGGSQELRYYSSDGVHLATVGGRGEGPGEFLFLSTVQRLPGDTVAAADGRTRRISIYGPEPKLATTLSWGDVVGGMPEGTNRCALPGFAGMTEGRRVLFWGWGCIRGEGAVGLRAYDVAIEAWDTEAASTTPVATFPMVRAWERPTEEPLFQFTNLPLTSPRPWDLTWNALHLGALDRFEIATFDPEGLPRRIIRDETPRRVVTPTMRDAYLAGLSEVIRAGMEGVPFPDSLPGFDRLFASENEIWGRHAVVADDTLIVWSAYTADGSRVDRVAFPAAFDLSSVSGGLAYGTVTDELDIQRIRVYRLPRAR